MDKEFAMEKFSEPLGGRLPIAAPDEAAPAGWMALLFALPSTALEHALTWRERWRQRQALLALDDRMLRDIGLDPGMVERECRKRPWQV
jgi:uncharacterized protein YjiS (DUF1127 family)